MTKPTILLIPGAFHPATIYKPAIDLLHSLGYPTQTLELPSLAPANPDEDPYGLDVRAVHQRLTKLVEEDEKEVVLVVHSYAGMPGADWEKELSKEYRKEKGLRGGVVRLVFVMAFAVAGGFCPTANGEKFPDWMKVDDKTQTWSTTVEDAKKVFYNDMSEEEGDKWAKQLTNHSINVFKGVTKHAAWEYVPSTFVNCMRDNTSFSQDMVKYLIGSAQTKVPIAFDVVEVCEGSGHSPMLSHVEWFAGVLRRAAGEVAQSPRLH